MIIQPGALGDGILTLPLIRMLRREGRLDRIDLMGHREKLGFLQGRSDISDILSIEGADLHRLFVDSQKYELSENDPLVDQFRNYELIITFLTDDQGHFERNLAFATMSTHAADVVSVRLHPPGDYPNHVAYFYMEQFICELPYSQVGIYPKVMEEPLIYSRPDDSTLGKDILNSNDIKIPDNLIALHPGSGSRDKCWPLPNYQNLIDQLKIEGFQPFIILGPVERERWNSDTIDALKSQVPILQELTLDEVTAVLSCSHGYIGNDSGISHLAGALGIVTIAIFGPTKHQLWRPLGAKVSVCEQSVVSRPLWPAVDEVWRQFKQLFDSEKTL